ncbi:MAG TPA: glycosyltransferase [Anaerolineaceae bacterium]
MSESGQALRLGLQQRVLPAYRVPFFTTLAGYCGKGLGIFAGHPRIEEAIETQQQVPGALVWQAKNLHLLSGKAYLCWQQGLLPWLEAWQPDALVMEANPRYLSSLQAVHWMRARHRPVIGWGLGAPGGSGALGIRRYLRMAFLRQFDALIAYSRQGAEQYRNLGFPAERVFVALNAAVPRPLQPAPERPPEFQGKATVLFVGRLQERKRLDLLLHACAALPKDSQPRLVIVGEGPAGEALRRLAAQVYPQAEFAGAHHGQALAPYYDTADLFVLPGTGGLAVQQAMAHALPVIVAEADGTQADLVRPQNGWLLPPGNLAELKSTLEQALISARRLRAMGAESYRIVAEEVNVERMAEVFIQAVEIARQLRK